MRQLIIRLIFFTLPAISFGQDANQLISELTAKMNLIRDYSASVKITAEIPAIKIEPVQATVYFKQKDKFKIISKGIAILPKQGFTDISRLLRQKNTYSAIITGSETIRATKTSIATILPVSDTMDLILAKLWIDPASDIVLKSQVTTRSTGTVTVDYTYGSQKSFGLPDNMVFTVDVQKFKIPKGIATDINKTAPAANKSGPGTGKIYVSLSGYVVNKGIKDDIFK